MAKILIANRGEIACRVIRTAQRMGHKTVAVYSDADTDAKHVKMADEAYNIGQAPSNESYLVMEKIIEVARNTGVDMIHPGYGFLSENATFAEALAANNITFIGPSIQAIQTMGSKLEAKAAVKDFDIPMVPGTESAIENVEEAKQIASTIGFPILIKASAGGGGKGMRLVENMDSFEQQMEMAISEAESAFGDGAVFIEKFVENPRHIEVQILADNFGNVIHINERECSIQRRHQKVVEEAPGSQITPALRKKLGEAAINVAKSCQYSGAGTVEFLMDKDQNFYFLEMNTRLQVEHPVTEMITGIDLVEEQILIAQNQTLRYKQEDIQINGHAIELRIYAENARDNFLPSIGTLETYQKPIYDFVRVDDAYEEGQTIPIYYDPMIAKLIVWGPTRQTAIERMQAAIAAYKIDGLETTLEFGSFVMQHPAFVSGAFDTKFVQTHYSMDTLQASKISSFNIASVLASKLVREIETEPSFIEDQYTEHWRTKV